MSISPIKRIEKIVSFEKKRVYEKDIADALNMDHSLYSETIKKDELPYAEIVEFGKKHKIDLNYLFCKQINIEKGI